MRTRGILLGLSIALATAGAIWPEMLSGTVARADDLFTNVVQSGPPQPVGTVNCDDRSNTNACVGALNACIANSNHRCLDGAFCNKLKRDSAYSWGLCNSTFVSGDCYHFPTARCGTVDMYNDGPGFQCDNWKCNEMFFFLQACEF